MHGSSTSSCGSGCFNHHTCLIDYRYCAGRTYSCLSKPHSKQTMTFVVINFDCWTNLFTFWVDADCWDDQHTLLWRIQAVPYHNHMVLPNGWDQSIKLFVQLARRNIRHNFRSNKPKSDKFSPQKRHTISVTLKLTTRSSFDMPNQSAHVNCLALKLVFLSLHPLFKLISTQCWWGLTQSRCSHGFQLSCRRRRSSLR